jgi:hypothetical protein
MVTFKRAEAIGDLSPDRIDSKSTEIKQITAGESKKSFKKYFYGSQFRQSIYQDRQGYEDVVSQALDQYNIEQDKLLLTGDGEDDASVINAGLFYSNDSNYVKESSATVATGSAGAAHLDDLYDKMVAGFEEADTLNGDKLIFTYGDTMNTKLKALFQETKRPFISVLREGLVGGDSVNVAKMPSEIVPGGNGWIIVNLDQIKLHWTTFGKIEDQDINREKKYAWTNLIMGSTMLEVTAKKGITHQPVTFA